MAYCTTTDVKLWGGWTDTDANDDALFGVLIPYAQQMVDSYTGRTFEIGTGTNDSDASTDRYFDAESDIRDSYTLELDNDLCKIISITVDGKAISSNSYVTEPRNDAPYWGVTILGNSTDTWDYGTDSENAINIDGFWTYSTSAPADIKLATIILVDWLKKQRNSDLALTAPIIDAQSGVTVMPVQTPTVVRQILNAYRKPTFLVV